MMETELKIPIPNTKFNIYAKQYGNLDNSVVVFVHGLTGHMDEQLFYNGARYFEKRGISSLRFNLYDGQEDARKLTDCTLVTHAHDFSVVVEYLREKNAKKIFAIGHSYGGPTVLLTDQSNIDSIVLWEPSYGDFFQEEGALYIKELDAYRIRWGIDILIGSSMKQEAAELNWDTLASNVHVPLKVIAAGNGILKNSVKKYVEMARGEKAYSEISGAGHNFDEDGVAEKLFDESLEWLKAES